MTSIRHGPDNAGGAARMAIDDPKELARQGGNNFPYSAGRKPQKQDDNEFVLLEVADFLKAK
jgi:hypothetical protein